MTSETFDFRRNRPILWGSDETIGHEHRAVGIIQVLRRRDMGLLGSLKSLFGSGGEGRAAKAADPVEYNGFQIQPAPERRDGGWNTAGVITKTIDGEPKEHRFIRVDTHSSLDDAISFSVTKAQQIIDEQGDNLFRSKR